MGSLSSEASLSSCQFSGASYSKSACGLDSVSQSGLAVLLDLASTKRLEEGNMIYIDRIQPLY